MGIPSNPRHQEDYKTPYAYQILDSQTGEIVREMHSTEPELREILGDGYDAVFEFCEDPNCTVLKKGCKNIKLVTPAVTEETRNATRHGHKYANYAFLGQCTIVPGTCCMGRERPEYRDPEAITGKHSVEKRRKAYQAKEEIQINAQCQCCTTTLEWTFRATDVYACSRAGMDPATARGLTFIFSLAGTNFVGPSIADHTQRDTLCGKKYNKKIIPFMCMYGVNRTGSMHF